MLKNGGKCKVVVWAASEQHQAKLVPGQCIEILAPKEALKPVQDRKLRLPADRWVSTQDWNFMWNECELHFDDTGVNQPPCAVRTLTQAEKEDFDRQWPGAFEDDAASQDMYTNISDLPQTQETSTIVDIQGRVKMQPGQLYTNTVFRRSVTIEDETGSCNVMCWDLQALQEFEVGKWYSFRTAEVNCEEKYGFQVNANWFTVCEEIF